MKAAIKREQNEVYFDYAEREQARGAASMKNKEAESSKTTLFRLTSPLPPFFPAEFAFEPAGFAGGLFGNLVFLLQLLFSSAAASRASRSIFLSKVNTWPKSPRESVFFLPSSFTWVVLNIR